MAPSFGCCLLQPSDRHRRPGTEPLAVEIV
jgi:hypothetical protein